MPAAGFSGVLVEAGPGGRPALFDGALETLTASDAESARSEERRVGKDADSVDLGGRRIIKKKNFFQAEDGIRDSLA